MLCTNCGKEVPDTAKVCGYCGHRLKEVVQAAPVPIPISATPAFAKPKAPGWMWPVIAVMAVLVVVAIGAGVLLARKWASVATPLPVVLPAASSGLEPVVDADIPVDNQEAEPVNPVTQEPVIDDKRIIVEPIENGDPTASLASLGTESGTNMWIVNIASTTPAKLNWGWCAATQAILDQNLANMDVAFYVDDVNVTDSIGQSTVEAKDEQTSIIYYCHNYHGIIRSWTAGKHIIIYQMNFKQKINDGWEDAEGARSRTYVVNVTP